MRILGELKSAQLELLSSTPSNAPTGRIYFDTTAGVVKFYTGSAWQAFGVVAGATSGTILPAADNTYDLGSASFRWRDFFGVEATLTSTTALSPHHDQVGVLTINTDQLTPFLVNQYTNTTDHSIVINHARGTSSAPTQMQVDNRILTLLGGVYNGPGGGPGGASDWAHVADIRFHAAENHSVGSCGTYMVFTTTTIGSVTRAERMRITDAGRVGIGTTAPTTRLEVKGSTSDSTAAAFNVSKANDTTILNARNDGLIGMGTTAPLGRLHVRSADSTTGSVASSASTLVLETGGATGMSILTPAANSGEIRFGRPGDNGRAVILYNHSTETMSFATGGTSTHFHLKTSSVGIGTTTVGSRLVVKGTGATSATSSLNVTKSTDVSILFVRDDGLVGIGNNTSPAFALDVDGGSAIAGQFCRTSASTDIGALNVYNPNTTDTNGIGVNFCTDTTGSGATVRLGLAQIISDFTLHDHATRTSTLKFYTSVSGTLAERMRVHSTGFIGMNVTSPLFRLDVDGVAALAAQFRRQSAGTDIGAIQLYNSNTTDGNGLALTFATDTTGAGATTGQAMSRILGDTTTHDHATRTSIIRFATSVAGTLADRMRIHTNGYVGIGNAAPNVLLNVGTGTPTAAADGLQFGGDASANLYRSAASTIKCDGAFTAVGEVTGSSLIANSITVGSSANTVSGVNTINPSAGNGMDSSTSAAVPLTLTAYITTTPAGVVTRRSKNATIGVHGALGSGDVISSFVIGGSDGASFINTAAMRALTSEAWSVGNNGTQMEFQVTANGAASRATVWTILNDGKLQNNKAASESTGAGSAALGANCPAVTASAPYTWLSILTSDGSTVYIPVWK